MPTLGVVFDSGTGVLRVTLTGPGTMELTVTGRPTSPGEVINEVSVLVESLYPALLVALRQCTTDPGTLSGLALLEQIHRIRTGNRLVVGDMVDIEELFDDEALRRLVDGEP